MNEEVVERMKVVLTDFVEKEKLGKTNIWITYAGKRAVIVMEIEQ